MILRSVPKGSLVADIGTDHAFLAIALRKTGTAKHVIACDINKGPLANAAENVNKTKTDGITLRLSDGLGNIKPNEVDVIVAAGMGGDVIASIISRAEWLKDSAKTLILQPMSSADALHEYLYNNGFEIVCENAVFDSGRCYVVITAKYDGKKRKLGGAKLFIGELKPDDGEAEYDFARRQLERVSACAESLKAVERKQKEYRKMLEATKELERLLGNGDKQRQ